MRFFVTDLFKLLSVTGLFHTVAVFSSANGPDFETKYAAALDHPDATNSKLKQLWIDLQLLSGSPLEKQKLVKWFQVSGGKSNWLTSIGS